MLVLFEVIKGIYFVMSIFVGIFFLRGSYILPDAAFKTIGYLLMPLYLILTGVVVGYVISLIWKINVGESDQEFIKKIDIRSFLIGIIVGCVIALVYIYVI